MLQTFTFLILPSLGKKKNKQLGPKEQMSVLRWNVPANSWSRAKAPSGWITSFCLEGPWQSVYLNVLHLAAVTFAFLDKILENRKVWRRFCEHKSALSACGSPPTQWARYSSVVSVVLLAPQEGEVKASPHKHGISWPYFTAIENTWKEQLIADCRSWLMKLYSTCLPPACCESELNNVILHYAHIFGGTA